MSQKPTDIVLPIVHLNGDRKSTLIAQLEAAYEAIRRAQDALRECHPNARNYYPQPGRYEQAARQHRARQEALQTVLDSLVVEVEGIQAAYPTAR